MNIKRRDFLQTIAVGGLAAATGGLFTRLAPSASGDEARAETGGVPKRPNIVIFISDDHSLRDVGCYGNDLIRTVHDAVQIALVLADREKDQLKIVSYRCERCGYLESYAPGA